MKDTLKALHVSEPGQHDPYLVNAVKELAAKNDALEARIEPHGERIMTRARDLADGADKDITGTLTTDGLTVAGNVSVDGGTIKLDGNYPTGTNNVALGNTALDSVQSGGDENIAIGSNALDAANTTGDQNMWVSVITLFHRSNGLDRQHRRRTQVHNAGASITTGDSNTFFGHQSGEHHSIIQYVAVG